MDTSKSKNTSPPNLAFIVFNNLKELIKAKNAAHESIFKLHWKKMWPFNLLWPQVDFLRIIRLMKELESHAQDQKRFIASHLKKAEKVELEFLNVVPAYLDAFITSCNELSKVAQFKQDKLEKKEKRSVFLFNKILKSYENAQKRLVQQGALVHIHWQSLQSS